MFFFCAELNESLSLSRNNVPRYSNNYSEDATVPDEQEDETRHKQMLLHMHEDLWELESRKEVAEAVQKIEQDSRLVNEIFHDLAKIVHVSQYLHRNYFDLDHIYRKLI